LGGPKDPYGCDLFVLLYEDVGKGNQEKLLEHLAYQIFGYGMFKQLWKVIKGHNGPSLRLPV
jgi:hypothetical protein